MLAPTRNKSAETVKNFLLQSIIIPFGNFDTLICDDKLSLQASSNFQNFLDLYNITRVYNSVASPWQSAKAERAVASIKEQIRKIILATGSSWDQYVGHIANSINERPEKSRFSAECFLFGYSRPNRNDILHIAYGIEDETEYQQNVRDAINNISSHATRIKH